MSRLIILMYHIVDHSLDATEAKYCCLPDRFDAQMHYLAHCGLPLVSLDQLAECRRQGTAWPDHGIAVTFDDGFADFHANAMPSLQRHGVPATMFVVTDRFGATNDWMHTREYPKRRLMTLEQLKDIHQRGVCLGTHTRSHACLPELNQAQLDTEIRDSKADLEAAIGDTVQHFAYPFGQYNEAARNTVEAAGYATACSTRSGFNRADVDPFQLRRIEVYGSDSLARFQKKLRFGVNDMPWYFTPRYYLKRVGQKLGLN